MITTLILLMTRQAAATAQSFPVTRNAATESGADTHSPAPNPATTAEMPQASSCAQPEAVVATMLDGYIAFVNATPIHGGATAWPTEQMETTERIYREVILSGYAGERGFGSVKAWAQAFGISQAPAACPGPDCCNAGGALRFMFVSGEVNKAGWYDYPGLARIPAIQSGCDIPGCPKTDTAYHELAHLWDFRLDGALSAKLDEAMGVVRKANRRVDVDHYFGRAPVEAYLPSGQPPVRRHGDFPSSYFDSTDPRQPVGDEHFAETVAAYFLVTHSADYYYAVCWTDEDPRCPAGAKYEYDRYDFMMELFKAAVEADGAAD